MAEGSPHKQRHIAGTGTLRAASLDPPPRRCRRRRFSPATAATSPGAVATCRGPPRRVVVPTLGCMHGSPLSGKCPRTQHPPTQTPPAHTRTRTHTHPGFHARGVADGGGSAVSSHPPSPRGPREGHPVGAAGLRVPPGWLSPAFCAVPRGAGTPGMGRTRGSPPRRVSRLQRWRRKNRTGVSRIKTRAGVCVCVWGETAPSAGDSPPRKVFSAVRNAPEQAPLLGGLPG